MVLGEFALLSELVVPWSAALLWEWAHPEMLSPRAELVPVGELVSPRASVPPWESGLRRTCPSF